MEKVKNKMETVIWLILGAVVISVVESYTLGWQVVYKFKRALRKIKWKK